MEGRNVIVRDDLTRTVRTATTLGGQGRGQVMQEGSQERGDGGVGRTGLKALMEDYERSLIVEALEASGGHQRRTAARLGILPTTLHEKMKRLGLLRPRRQEVLASGLGAFMRPAAMMASPYGSRR
jgi:DNA-binding NtrC family response regulator